MCVKILLKAIALVGSPCNNVAFAFITWIILMRRSRSSVVEQAIAVTVALHPAMLLEGEPSEETGKPSSDARNTTALATSLPRIEQASRLLQQRPFSPTKLWNERGSARLASRARIETKIKQPADSARRVAPGLPIDPRGIDAGGLLDHPLLLHQLLTLFQALSRFCKFFLFVRAPAGSIDMWRSIRATGAGTAQSAPPHPGGNGEILTH